MPPRAAPWPRLRVPEALDRLLDPAPSLVLAMAFALVVTDQLVLRIRPGVLPEGPFDETAHLLTGALVLVALPRVPARQLAVGLLVSVAAVAWPARRTLLAGATVGLAAHFFRDLSESSAGVPLLWPLSSHAYTLPHWTYLAVMAAVSTVALARTRGRQPEALSR